MSNLSHACVVGLGYVGLPLAVALAEAGVQTTGIDASERRVTRLRDGASGIEDVSDEALRAALAAGFAVSDSISAAAAATTYVICVPTPLRDGQPDLRAVESAAGAVGTVLSRGDLVILESTTYPGTTEDVVGPLLQAASGLAPGTDFLLAYSPERIDPGNPHFGLKNTPKIVGGSDERSAKAARVFYERVVDSVVEVSGTREAEMAKLLENTFRHINIALVNEMAVFCNELGIDLWEVIAAAKTKPFGFMPFYPGPGVGGHCIPVDPSYLSWSVKKLGHSFRFVELAQDVNAAMPAYVVSRLAEILNGQGLALSRSRVLCLGVAYKPGVSDCRESPALDVVEKLMRAGADVRYADPHVDRVHVGGRELRAVDCSPAELGISDVVVLLTPHAQFDLDVVATTARSVLDTRGVLDRSRPGIVRL